MAAVVDGFEEEAEGAVVDVLVDEPGCEIVDEAECAGGLGILGYCHSAGLVELVGLVGLVGPVATGPAGSVAA